MTKWFEFSDCGPLAQEHWLCGEVAHSGRLVKAESTRESEASLLVAAIENRKRNCPIILLKGTP